MKDNEYRCSSCNQIKREKDHVLIQWNQEDDFDIQICKPCDIKMKKLNYRYLEDFLDLKIKQA